MPLFTRILYRHLRTNSRPHTLATLHWTRTISTTRATRLPGDASPLQGLRRTTDLLSDTEMAMQEMVCKFANDVLLLKAREMDELEQMDKTVIDQLFQQGLMGIQIPEEYGGAGMNFMSTVIAIEELSRVDASVGTMVDVHNILCSGALSKYGSQLLKERWLLKLATDTVAAFCLSEPVSGSDAFAMATKATETESSFRISGSKMWITNFLEADMFIVFANLDPSKGYRVLRLLLLKKLGIRASSTCALSFNDVKIPKENLLGERGQGYKYAVGLLNESRIGVAAQMVGIALEAFENAVNYVWNDRKQFGAFVEKFQGMQHQIAQAYAEISAARGLVYKAAQAMEAKEDFFKDEAIAKLYASQIAGKVSGQAIEWMSGMGFVREGPAEKFWRDSKIGAIYEGTNNIQLNTISKLLQREYKQ
ncbi:acyl-CoA dehydrogenase [Trichoderma velutinum]